MPNIKFNYLYRDSANYKSFGFIIFDNPTGISLEIFLNIIKSKLIDGTCFYADQWHLPELYLDAFNNKLDPTWHEFESIEFTYNTPNRIMTLSEFIKIIKLAID